MFDSPGAGYREQVQRIDRKLPRLRIAARKSTEVVSGLSTENVTPEAIAKTYRGSLTRLTEKPKSISAGLAEICTNIPDDKKYGPHSRRFVHHYRNDLAKTAKGNFPTGSVLVKEKLIGGKGAEPVLSGATGMIKQPAGTSPKTGDWLFFEVWGGQVQPTKAESCAGCHSGAKRDYVFTDLPKR